MQGCHPPGPGNLRLQKDKNKQQQSYTKHLSTNIHSLPHIADSFSSSVVLGATVESKNQWKCFLSYKDSNWEKGFGLFCPQKDLHIGTSTSTIFSPHKTHQDLPTGSYRKWQGPGWPSLPGSSLPAAVRALGHLRYRMLRDPASIFSTQVRSHLPLYLSGVNPTLWFCKTSLRTLQLASSLRPAFSRGIPPVGRTACLHLPHRTPGQSQKSLPGEEQLFGELNRPGFKSCFLFTNCVPTSKSFHLCED